MLGEVLGEVPARSGVLGKMPGGVLSRRGSRQGEDMYPIHIGDVSNATFDKYHRPSLCFLSVEAAASAPSFALWSVHVPGRLL